MKRVAFIPTLIPIMGIAALLGSAGAADISSGSSPTGRFAILDTFRQEAVFDKATQLIWERTPNETTVTWSTAQTRCGLKTVGGHSGWRLPSFIELMTLIEPHLDHNSSSLPALPAGHPFRGVQPNVYWTSDASSSEPGMAYTVDFLRADVAPSLKTLSHPLWCVRGGISDHVTSPQAPVKPGLI